MHGYMHGFKQRFILGALPDDLSSSSQPVVFWPCE